jgi:predicted enzyme related to lactoylglutathione lyase
VTLEGGITIFASDLGASRRFYGEQLGLTVEEDEDGFWARRDGVALRVEGGARKRRLSREFYEEAGILVRIETDSFDTFLGSITARGIKLFSEVKDSSEGRFAGFVDPDGNLFELIETGV